MTLEDKVILVTGAESGIGLAIATECLAQGARVCMAGIAEQHLATAVQELDRAYPERVLRQVVDITDYPGVEAMFLACIERFGRVDGVVANAGIVIPDGPFHEIDLDAWDRVIRVNLTGTFYTLRAAAGVLRTAGRGGSILVTGSSSAVRVVPGMPSYCASKGGVHLLAQSLALELAEHNIRVNVLVPGTAATPAVMAMPGYRERVEPLLPMGKLVEPGELARMAAFALSDAVPHMTGTQLKVDSGRTIA